MSYISWFWFSGGLVITAPPENKLTSIRLHHQPPVEWILGNDTLTLWRLHQMFWRTVFIALQKHNVPVVFDVVQSPILLCHDPPTQRVMHHNQTRWGGQVGEKLPNNGRQIMHCDLLLWRGLNQTIVLVGARICHNPATTDKKGNVSLFSRPKYASLAISITKGFGIPLSYSRVLRRRGWFFPTGKTRFLFFNPPLCQRRGQHGR